MHEEASHHLFSDFASADPGSPVTTHAPVKKKPGGSALSHLISSSAEKESKRTSSGSLSAGTPTGSSGPRLMRGRGENPSESWKEIPARYPLLEKTEGMAICGMKHALPRFA